MERRLTSSRVSTARRPTEASKALSVGKDKSLSAVSLTKRTNSLVYDVEAIKTNLKGLEEQGREIEQQEQTVLLLSDKVAALQQAFESLSDVCIYVEDSQKRMYDTVDHLQQRVAGLEKSVATLQAHASKSEAKRKQFQDTSERRFSDFQEAFSKLALSVYETQADVGRVKNSTDDLMAREREATHLTQSLQATQEQASDWLQKLKTETSQLSTELFTLKEHTGATTISLASDVQVLAKECSGVRSTMVQQHAQWLHKVESLREAIDRQSKIEKAQLTQRLDALGETVATHEQRTKDSLNTLLKNHARIREAVDESMAICSSEIKILSQEAKAVQDDHRGKLEELVQQLAQQSLDASQKYETLRCSVRSMAIQLDVTV